MADVQAQAQDFGVDCNNFLETLKKKFPDAASNVTPTDFLEYHKMMKQSAPKQVCMMGDSGKTEKVSKEESVGPTQTVGAGENNLLVWSSTPLTNASSCLALPCCICHFKCCQCPCTTMTSRCPCCPGLCTITWPWIPECFACACSRCCQLTKIVDKPDGTGKMIVRNQRGETTEEIETGVKKALTASRE